MDIHVVGPERHRGGTRGRRRPARPARRRLGRRRPRHRARRAQLARRTSGRDGAAPPAAAGLPRRAGPCGLGQPRRHELHLPASHRAAGRGVGRADVLSPVCDRAAGAGGGARLRRHRLPRARRRGAVRVVDRARSDPRAPTPDGRDTTWMRSPCLGQCERAPAALVVRAGTPAARAVVAPVRVGRRRRAGAGAGRRRAVTRIARRTARGGATGRRSPG